MAAKKRAKKSAFVPEVLVRSAIAGVIPACALVACGGGTVDVGDGGGESGGDSGSDVFRGVAAVAYPAYEAGRVDTGIDGADTGAIDGGRDVFLGVAAVAYPAYEAGKG